jgi:crotonobetainyl-CoA:carnitine CoA-transferase CaiB-like acyl-CoA transferase
MKPFAGVKIIDLTHVLSGPFCTYQLANLGADVIKIEEPRQGDYMRRRGSDNRLRRRLMGDHFISLNANKRSIVVDLAKQQGAEVVRRLARHADVLVENFRTGVMDRLGLGYEHLRADNHRLVYCAITAYGSAGPERARKAYDQVVQARSGLMAATAFPGGPAIKTGAPVLDYATGAMAAFAIAAALLQRERGGTGQFIDVAMQDTALMLMSTSIMNLLHGGKPPAAHGNEHPLAAASCYVAADGEPIMLGCCTQTQFDALCRLIGRADLARDPRFRDVNHQEPHRQALHDELAKTMATRDAASWEELLADQVPASRVRSLAETLASEQVAARGVLQRIDRVPEAEAPITVPVAAFTFAHDGPEISAPPPLLGEHTETLLAEYGFTAREIAELLAEGAVAGWDQAKEMP